MKMDRPRLPATRPGATYEIGYGKPPVTSRFKPGQSGNPKGRPKGAKNTRPGMHEERMKEIILDEAYREITVRDGDRNVTIPMAQAILRSMAVNAAKGQHRAQRLFAELLASVESARKMENDELFRKALDYKLGWEDELRRRARLGITDQPDPLPHPDHITLDMNTGTARIIGPVDREPKEALDWAIANREGFEGDLDTLAADLETVTDPKERKEIEEDIAGTQRILDMIDRLDTG